ncbi:hypothetical protein pdul_cds_12 [Pandoravirus dulcis]|uniref:Uncharacterized protein n=1 Tax=Pandoravirus dulcis TaxID=1349409 RepID=S4VNQ6_9VIRU|nr:hypothetical protein pdul_cds_12 [Pandoravirus dulcis]AGO81882.1 hypothetical protein pdul_cds_12 [Pandoravirus dulcis]
MERDTPPTRDAEMDRGASSDVLEEASDMGITTLHQNSGPGADVMRLLGPDLAARVAALPADDPQRAKASVVASFLRWLTAKDRAPTGPEAAQWMRDSGLVAWDENLQDDVEGMVDVAAICDTSPSGLCTPVIAASALVMTAQLLVASHVVGVWPFTILVSPQDTLNFKSPTSPRTLIVYGAPEGATLFEHGTATAFNHVPAANTVDVYVRQFLEAPASALEAALCGLLSAATANIGAD